VTANCRRQGATRGLFATVELVVKLTINRYFTSAFTSLNFCMKVLIKKLSNCWDSSRYDNIGDSGRSANPSTEYDLCKMSCQYVELCTKLCCVS